MNSKIKTVQQTLVIILIVAFCILLSSCGKKQKVYRVGILSGLDFFADTADGFKAKLTELGYVEGKNIVYDFQKVNINPAAEQRILKKFVEDKVDLIFTFPTEPAVSAKAVTEETGIPVVFANAMIEGNNLVESLQHPGGNITGVRFPASETTTKRLEILHEIVPLAKRFYIPYDKNYPGINFTIDALHETASSINITLVESPVTSVEEIKTDLDARFASGDIGIDAILIMPTLLTAGPEGFGIIQKFAAEHRLAIGGSINNNADNDAVFSYIPQNVDMGRLAASLADKVLKGIPAGTIPVVSPEAYLRINYKAIQELGLTVPEGLLNRANEIIH